MGNGQIYWSMKDDLMVVDELLIKTGCRQLEHFSFFSLYSLSDIAKP